MLPTINTDNRISAANDAAIAANDENILSVLNESSSFLEEIKTIVISDRTTDLLSLNQETLDEIRQILKNQVEYTALLTGVRTLTTSMAPDAQVATAAAIDQLITSTQETADNVKDNIVVVSSNDDKLNEIENNTRDLKTLDEIKRILNDQVELEKTTAELQRIQIENEENAGLEEMLERERAERRLLAREERQQRSQGTDQGGSSFLNMLGLGAGAGVAGAGIMSALRAGLSAGLKNAAKGGGLLALASVFGDEIGLFLGENVSAALIELGVNPEFAKNLEDTLKTRTTAALTMAGLSKVLLGRTLPGIVVEGILGFFDLPSLTDPRKLLDALKLKIKENFGEGAANNVEAATGTAQEIVTIIAAQIYKMFGLEELVPPEKRDEVNKMFEDAFTSFLDRDTVQEILSIPARILDGTLKDDIVAAGVSLAGSMGSMLTEVSTEFGNKLRDEFHDSALERGASREQRSQMRSRFNNYGQGAYASDEEISQAIVSEENETAQPAPPSRSTSVLARVAGYVLGKRFENMDSLERAGGPSPYMRLSMDANYEQRKDDGASAEELERMPTADNNYNFDPAFDLMDGQPPRQELNIDITPTGTFRVESRGSQINNPGNMRTGERPFEGEVTSPDQEFRAFESLPLGLRAVDELLQGSRYLGAGKNTIEDVMNVYAPASDNNDTRDIIRFVSSETGISPTAPIDLSDPVVRSKLVSAIVKRETEFIIAPREVQRVVAEVNSLIQRNVEVRNNNISPMESARVTQPPQIGPMATGYVIPNARVEPMVGPNTISDVSKSLSKNSVAIIQPVNSVTHNTYNNSTNTSVAGGGSRSMGADRTYNIDRSLMNIVNNRTYA